MAGNKRTAEDEAEEDEAEKIHRHSSVANNDLLHMGSVTGGASQGYRSRQRSNVVGKPAPSCEPHSQAPVISTIRN
jgi:hypothetical protein